MDDFTVLTWFKQWYRETKDSILKELLHHLFIRKPFYEVIRPPSKRVQYSEEKNNILGSFKNEEEQVYYFWEDSPSNIAYKDLYIGELLEEVYVFDEGNGAVIPLSAVKDSIISKAKDVLEKDKVLWYVKHEKEVGQGDGNG